MKTKSKSLQNKNI